MQISLGIVLLVCSSVAVATLSQQQPVRKASLVHTADSRIRIPGTNNATYGHVPIGDQLFDIQFLEVLPFPIVSDQLYYMYLYGLFWPGRTTNPTQSDLNNATLSITSSIVYTDGSQDVGSPWTIPLQTTLLNRFQHIGIRNEDGLPTDRMTLGEFGDNDIVADGWIPKQFVVSGNWTMEFDARIPDGRCLFDFSMTQWVDGDYQRPLKGGGEWISDMLRSRHRNLIGDSKLDL